MRIFHHFMIKHDAEKVACRLRAGVAFCGMIGLLPELIACPTNSPSHSDIDFWYS